MNLAHVHLLLNHIPIVGIPLALIFLAYGMIQKNSSVQRFSLFVLVGLAAMVIPTYLTGEPAEEIVEHLVGVVESTIEAHEEAAEVSLILTLLTGGLALVALFFQKNERFRKYVNLGVFGIAAFACVSLGYTANLGGKVRHSEFSGASSGVTPVDGADKGSEKDDDD